MSDGWGDALSLTVRELYLYPALPRWRHASMDVLTDEQAEIFLEWRKEAARLLGYSRHLDGQLTKLLDCAAGHLESVQGELAAAHACRTTCPESGWQDAAPQCARDLYAAVMALSRTAGPEVLLSDRVAVDLIESMTVRRWVFGENRPGITRAKRWLESRGYFTIKTMKGSRTTVYCVLLQGTLADAHKCLVALAGVPDSRPVLGELDRLVFRVSVDLLKVKHAWRPGQAVAEARQVLEERQRAAEPEAPDLTQDPAYWTPYPLAEHDRHTDFSELLGGDGNGDRRTRRCDDDEEPGAGHG